MMAYSPVMGTLLCATIAKVSTTRKRQNIMLSFFVVRPQLNTIDGGVIKKVFALFTIQRRIFEGV